jgi:Tol biopolymer transport system component
MGGSEGNGPSSQPDLSDDGRYSVFQSWADNLVPGDSNSACDVFRFDRDTGATVRVSKPQAGGEADGDSTHPAISGDGRFVSFSSAATNLVLGDTNDVADIFVVDCETGSIERVNLGSDGGQASAGGGLFPESALSRDGRLVAYTSMASDLVEPPAPPLVEQIYVTDRLAGDTQRISVTPAGEAADDRCLSPTLSADGRFVGFQTRARNLLTGDHDTVFDTYVVDRRTTSLRRISAPQLVTGQRGDSGRVAISPSGCTVAFSSRASDLAESDDNDASDVFLITL